MKKIQKIIYFDHRCFLERNNQLRKIKTIYSKRIYILIIIFKKGMRMKMKVIFNLMKKIRIILFQKEIKYHL